MYLLDATEHNRLRFYQVRKGHRVDLHCLLGQAIEQFASRCRSPAIESKSEFVEIFVHLMVPNCSLKSAEQPSLQQRDHAMHSWQDVSRFPLTALYLAVMDMPRLCVGAVELTDSLVNGLAATLAHGEGQGPAIAFGPAAQATVNSELTAPKVWRWMERAMSSLSMTATTAWWRCSALPTANLDLCPTAVGSTSSPQSVTIQNLGNAHLTETALTVGANFQQVPSSGTPADCASTFSLTPGESRNLSISFGPQSAGALATTAVLTDNALNTSSPDHQPARRGHAGIANHLIRPATHRRC